MIEEFQAHGFENSEDLTTYREIERNLPCRNWKEDVPLLPQSIYREIERNALERDEYPFKNKQTNKKERENG
jgi:hypothetical protein